MKILQLGKFYPIRGGVEKVMYDLILGLSERGVDCDMMCAETTGYGTIRNLDTGARVLSFRTWAKVASTTIAPSMVKALRDVANEYDLIHVHHPDPMAAIALRMSGYKGPVVLHWHSDIIKSKPMLKVYEPLQEWLLLRADAIITTNPVIARESEALMPHSHKVRTVPIGIKPMTHDPEGAEIIRGKHPGRKIIFSLGRLVPYKGYGYLVNAAAMLSDEYVVLIGGEGPMKESLTGERDSLGLGDRVRFVGRIPDEQLPAYYSACDVFCLPSVMKTEAFGIVQIEAMSLGKPVVATRIKGSGTAWVNSHGVSGMNVEPKDSVGLARAILSICGDSSLYDNLSRGAKERFENNFTLHGMIENCFNIYKELI